MVPRSETRPKRRIEAAEGVIRWRIRVFDYLARLAFHGVVFSAGSCERAKAGYECSRSKGFGLRERAHHVLKLCKQPASGLGISVF